MSHASEGVEQDAQGEHHRHGYCPSTVALDLFGIAHSDGGCTDDLHPNRGSKLSMMRLFFRVFFKFRGSIIGRTGFLLHGLCHVLQQMFESRLHVRGSTLGVGGEHHHTPAMVGREDVPFVQIIVQIGACF